MALVQDNLVNFIVQYKIQNYNKSDYDENGYLINYYSIRGNKSFIEFVVKNKYFPEYNKNNKKKFMSRLNYLSDLVEINNNEIMKIILNILNCSD